MFYLIKWTCNLWVKKWIIIWRLLLFALPCNKIIPYQLFCSPNNNFLETNYKYHWSLSLQNPPTQLFHFGHPWALKLFSTGFSSRISVIPLIDWLLKSVYSVLTFEENNHKFIKNQLNPVRVKYYNNCKPSYQFYVKV